MRQWFLWGLCVCCIGGSSAWAQECSSVGGIDRTLAELHRFYARQGPGLRASDAGGGRNFDVGQIAVVEDDGAGELFYRTFWGQETLDLPAVCRRFYRTHPDDFDFLTVFTASPIVDPITQTSFSAYSLLINNDIRGLHLPDLDYSADFGSAGNLEAVMNMNCFADPRYGRGPYERLPGNNDSTMSLLAHETGHRWGARVQVDDDPGPRVHRSDLLLGRSFSHWSFYLDAPTRMGSSSLEGNRWQFDGLGSFRSVAETDGYSALDQYLMGVRVAAEVPPFFVVDGARTVAAEESPMVGVQTYGLPHWFTIRDVTAVEGRRFPGLRSSAGNWRQAFVLVIPHGYAETRPGELQGLIERLDGVRREWEPYFFDSTAGRAQVHTELQTIPQPLYRLYGPARGAHFYTASYREFFNAVAFDGFIPEATEGDLFPTQRAGTVPVYRLFQPAVASHLYTTDPFEWEGAISDAGFVPEGVMGYLYPTPMPRTLPLYRLYHFGIADHFYTTRLADLEAAVAAGYVVEGILGYVLDAETPEVVNGE